MGSIMLSSPFQQMALQRLLRPVPLISLPFLKQSLPQTPSFQPILSKSQPLRTHPSIFRTFSQNPVSTSSQALLELESPDETADGEVNVPTVYERKLYERAKMPSLTVKEKKELGSYAHSLGKKLKSQQVGKSGVTDTVVLALDETLEANELLKLKIHGTCSGELEDIVKHIEEATGSVVVGQIGRTVILYRPSLTKLKAEEKKKLALKKFAYMKKQYAARQSFQGKGQVPRRASRGSQGSSRF